MIYTVGEAARQIDVAASTLRYYDKEGLLPFLERSGGGIRMFKDGDLSWLRTIECLKKTGMPIKDIKHFIDYCMEGDSRIDERLEIIRAQRESVIRQMEEMQSMLDMLSYKCWYYETSKEAGTCSIHDDMKKEDVPPEFHKYLNTKL
ncbi:MerR family transcriptional regulator [Youngiibacter fragilis]|uniref:MerR family transcriptional regulator n=1 Tax=Youngiibacter fragilis 232.1 TaxID=994573 RepID=V7I0S0_9CLOT|nr:MerR family transcriptional regulator [Youngiibacter fragilis]ETA79473.1 MerR family transcriptional regulator [Youngiibacter fragilis 232.1]